MYFKLPTGFSLAERLLDDQGSLSQERRERENRSGKHTDMQPHHFTLRVLAIDWARGSFGCKNLRTPVITFSYVSLVFSGQNLGPGKSILMVCQRGLRPAPKTSYTDCGRGKQDKVRKSITCSS